MDVANGFWQSIIIPELERKMESQMIANALGKNQSGPADKNDKGTRAAGREESKAAYPAGKRLRPNELDAARKTPLVVKLLVNPCVGIIIPTLAVIPQSANVYTKK